MSGPLALLLVIIGLGIIGLGLAAAANSRTARPAQPAIQPPLPVPPPPDPGEVFGRDLWFDRTSYPDYHNEFSTRMNQIRSLFEEDGWDIYAIWAIVAWETGWLSSASNPGFVVNHNNILGISYPLKPGEHYQRAYHFESVQACMAKFYSMMNSTRYHRAYALRGSGPDFIARVSHDGYNDSASWRSGVLSCYNRIVP